MDKKEKKEGWITMTQEMNEDKERKGKGKKNKGESGRPGERTLSMMR